MDFKKGLQAYELKREEGLKSAYVSLLSVGFLCGFLVGVIVLNLK